jgi:hypothetical protein
VRIFVSSAVSKRAVRAFPNFLLSGSTFLLTCLTIDNYEGMAAGFYGTPTDSFQLEQDKCTLGQLLVLLREALAVRLANVVVWNVAVVQDVQLTAQPAGTVGM